MMIYLTMNKKQKSVPQKGTDSATGQRSVPIKTELDWLFTTSWSSNHREITPDDVSMVTAMRRSHWMGRPNILSNGWLTPFSCYENWSLSSTS